MASIKAEPDGTRHDGVGFLLTQIGAHAADLFADRVASLDLTPPQAGLLRLIAQQPGSSQQQLAARLGMQPSRVVTFLDDLEERDLVRRERSRTDRRQHAVGLTSNGRATLRRIGTLARDHERHLVRGLDDHERAQLTSLLRQIADEQGLSPGVHPGFRRIRAGRGRV